MIRAYVAPVLDRRDADVERIYSDPELDDVHAKMDCAVRQLWEGCDLTDHAMIERTMVAVIEKTLEMRDSSTLSTGRRLACDGIMMLIFAIKVDEFMSRSPMPPTFSRELLIDNIARLLLKQQTSAGGQAKSTLIRWGCYCAIFYIIYVNISRAALTIAIFLFSLSSGGGG